MIFRKIPLYDLEITDFKKITDVNFLNGKYYIELPQLPNIFEIEKTLMRLADALILRVIKRSYSEQSNDIHSLKKEQCFYFNESDEWILEAEMNMKTADGHYRDKYFLRLPLSSPYAKEGKIGIYFDGTWIRFMKNGEILNENSGLDCFDVTCENVFIDDMIKDVKAARVKDVSGRYRKVAEEGTPAYLYPHGWNTNIGDVMPFYHNGVYHLVYLHDRRHHDSRNGLGAHSVHHFTTTDFKDWYEQIPIAEVERPWMSYGTGTMVFNNGKYYMTYGLHTERYKGLDEKIETDFFEDLNEFQLLSFDEIFKKGGLPAGASYSVSDDGINFTPSEMLVHTARNPSAYVENGKIVYYCGYRGNYGMRVYEAEGFDTPVKKTDTSIDAINKSVMGNTSECPALFHWNGYKYLLVGFTGYFRTLSENSEELCDVASMGEYIYDGLSVPMICEYKDNRRLICGWVKSELGWGSCAMHRELVFLDDGKLGMKWMSELEPAKIGENMANENENRFEIDKRKSYYLSLNVNPKGAKRIGLLLSDGKEECVVEADFINKRVQINETEGEQFAEKLETILEQMIKCGGEGDFKEKVGENIPQNAKNFALSGVSGMDKEFTFRMVLHYSNKIKSTILDIEIAGLTTMISARYNFYPSAITILKDGDCEVIKAELYRTDEE